MTDRQIRRLIRDRLAGRMHQRQANILRRLILLGRRLRRFYATAAGRIAARAEAQGFAAMGSLDQQIDAELRDVAGELRRELRQVIRHAHRTAADAIQASVPRWWLLAYARRRVLPVREKRDERAAAEMQLLLDLERVAKLSPDEAKALLDELLFAMPDADRIERVLSEPGPGGVNWDERLRHWESRTRTAMRTELTAGLAAGENVDQLRKRLRPLADGIGYKAQRIARTEGSRLAHRATQETYAAMGDAVEGQSIVAVMDEHTRPEHATRNGRDYRRGEDGVYRDAAGKAMPDLPDQPNCRCFAVPDLGMPDYIRKDPAAAATYEKAKLVPDPSTYADWWQQASVGQRKAAVGAKRYGAAKAALGREPRWPDFLDADGKLLPVSSIRTEGPVERVERIQRVTTVVKQKAEAFARVAAEHGGVVKPPKRSPADKTAALQAKLDAMRAANAARADELAQSQGRIAAAREKLAQIKAARDARQATGAELAKLRAKIKAAEEEVKQIDRRLRAEDRKRDRTR